MSVKALEYSYNLCHLHKVQTRVDSLFYFLKSLGKLFFEIYFSVSHASYQYQKIGCRVLSQIIFWYFGLSYLDKCGPINQTRFVLKP